MVYYLRGLFLLRYVRYQHPLLTRERDFFATLLSGLSSKKLGNLLLECGETYTMVAELVLPAVEAMGDFMDAEENKWWVRPLKALMYIGVFSVIPLYFYFS